MGYDALELVGTPWLELVHDDDVALVRERLREGLAGTDQPIRVEHRFRAKDDSWRSLDTSLSDRTDDRNFGGVLAISLDVTAHRMVERRAQELATAGLFTRAMAHDFNNVFTAIMGFADLLERDLPSMAPQKETARLIIDAINRGEELTRELLAFAEAERTRPDASEATRNDGSATLLVVDDREDVLLPTAQMLELFGYRVLTARSGADALTILRDPQRHIDLLMTDLVMPGMRGADLVRNARADRPSLPVLTVSGYHEQDETLASLGQEKLGFVQKPYLPDELLMAVRSLLA